MGCADGREEQVPRMIQVTAEELYYGDGDDWYTFNE